MLNILKQKQMIYYYLWDLATFLTCIYIHIEICLALYILLVLGGYCIHIFTIKWKIKRL